MGWVTRPRQEWPPPARWLNAKNASPLQREIVERALCDDGELESDGPNRSPYIDQLVRWAGLDPAIPGGVYWCAIWVARVFADAGAQIPLRFASCDAWLDRMVPLESVPPARRVGAAILYGVPGDAHHVGIIARWPKPTKQQLLPLTIEGNRGYAGSATNNGVAVDLAPLTRRDVLGVVLPQSII